MRKELVVIGCLITSMLACGKFSDDLRPQIQSSGMYITNEGVLGENNASISVIEFEMDQILNDVYRERNNSNLGDGLQSMYILNNAIFLVMNGSAKIEIASSSTLVGTGQIEGFESPRYFLPVDLMLGYVSDREANKVFRLDLATNEIDLEIPFPGWSEEMIVVGDNLFVTNPTSSGQVSNNKVYVISQTQGKIVDSIEVGFNPVNIAIDNRTRLWILCNGDVGQGIPGGLYSINPLNFDVEKELRFSDTNVSTVPRLSINDEANVLYYLKQDLYAVHISASELPSEPIVSAQGRNFYGMAANPFNGDIYIADAADFQKRGTVYRYSPEGEELASFVVGIAPNGFRFR